MNNTFGSLTEPTPQEKVPSRDDILVEWINEAYEFIERLESITTDKQVQDRIRTFLVERGYWPQN